jgi:hypothetical protein
MGKTTTDEDEDQTTTGTETDEDEEQTTEGVEVEEDEDDPEAEEAAILASLPPAAVALFEKTRERLAKANASSSNRRKVIQQMRAANKTTGTGTKVVKPGPGKTTESKASLEGFDPEAFKADILAALQGQQQQSTVERKAESAIKAAGLNLPEGEAGDRKLARVLRMVDWTNVAPDEVDDEIDDLKRENPELFTAKRKRPRTGGVGGPSTIKAAKPTNKFDDIFGV